MIPHNETEKTSGKNIEFEPVVRISKASRYAAKGLTHVAGPFLFGIANQVPGMVQNGDVVTRDLASAAWQKITETHWLYGDFIADEKWRRWACGHKQWILDMIETYVTVEFGSKVRHVSCDYIYGPTGTNKTSDVLRMYGAKNVFTVDLSSENFPFDGYAGEPVILIDDFRSDVKFNTLLRWMNPYPMKVSIKGSHMQAQWRKVVITSNLSLDEVYPNLTEKKNPLYRRFENGIVFKKMSVTDCLPYASLEDAMNGKPSFGYTNGVPGFDKTAAQNQYDTTWMQTRDVLVQTDAGFDDVDGQAYWESLHTVPVNHAENQSDSISQSDAMQTPLMPDNTDDAGSGEDLEQLLFANDDSSEHP